MALAELVDFELRPEEVEILACLEDLRGFPRQAIGSALVHLKRARKLVDVDLPMAVFRAITSEEEAAACLILVLRQAGYRNAERLNFRSHVHKMGLSPFLDILEGYFAGLRPMPPLRLRVRRSDAGTRLSFQLQILGHWLEPTPPLNFIQSDQASERAYFFTREIEKVLKQQGAKSLKDSLKEAASARQKLLYATPEGIPDVSSSGIEKILSFAQRRVFRFAAIAALIYPYKQRALFVQQVLDAFLWSVEGIESEWKDLELAPWKGVGAIPSV